MNDIPNYSEYSLGDLEDIYKHIDKEKYPEKFKIISDELNKKKAEPELQQILADENSNILTDEDRKTELIKLISIAGTILLFGIYTVYKFRSIIVSQFMPAYIPLFSILILSLLSVVFLSRRKYIGVELLMYSQVPLIVSFLVGNLYYFSNMGYLILIGINVSSGLGFNINFNFGNFQFILGKVNAQYSFLLGINIIPAILFIYLKLRADYYKCVFADN